jgi:hypothetical protein
MTISGSLPPIGGPNRAAQAYGVPRRPPAPTAPVGVDKGGAAEKTGGIGGSDALRSVLSDEERAYFDQIASLGPITYGRSAKAGMVPEAPRGLRLDVRG